MDWEWAFGPAVAGVAAVALVAAVVVALSGTAVVFDNEAAPALPAGGASGSYNPANETLRITMSTVEYTEDGDTATVWVAYDGSEPAAVHRGDTTVENGVWYAPDPPRILDRAVRPGDAVTVVGDGTDTDGDGTAGVECGEVYRVVITPPDGNPRTVAKFSIAQMGEMCDRAE